MTIAEMFENLDLALQFMTRGDEGFYSSLKDYHERCRRLSPSQEFHLIRLAQKYSPEEIEKEREFAESYSEDERTTAIRIAHYYNAQYPKFFETIVDRVLASPGEHVLSHKEYSKMCNNKYAKKILASYDEPAKFSVGEVAQIRANNRLDLANVAPSTGSPNFAYRNMAGNKACLVLEQDPRPITRASRGSRVYKILITDETRPIHAHESDLKKIRRSRK